MPTEIRWSRRNSVRQEDVHHIVTLVTNGVLNQTKEDVVKKLADLADELDAKQRDMNIAKTSFASSGILGSGLAVAGVILAPITFGASLGLTIAGVAVGVSSGLGGLVTVVADRLVNKKTLQKAQTAINRYTEKLSELLDLVNFFYSLTTDTDALEFDEHTKEEQPLIPTIKQRKKLELVLRGLKIGIDTGSSAAHIGGTVGSVAAAGGRGFLASISTGMTVARIGGLVLSVLTVPIDIHTLVTNSMKIHRKTPSEVAEQIRDMAKTLDQHHILMTDDTCVF